MRVSLCFFLSRHRHATVLCAGNYLQTEFAAKTNFGSVVAVERDAFEHSKEIASQLRVPLGDGIAVTRGAARAHADGFIQGSQQSELLCGRSVDEVLSIQLVALLVDADEAGKKIVAVLFAGPFREDDVDEFVDTGTLGARCVGLGN